MTLLRDLVTLVRGLPDWIAWRLDAFVTRANDRDLSPFVREAFNSAAYGEIQEKKAKAS